MFCCRAVALCLLASAFVDLCSGLVLERLPRHIPHSKDRMDSGEEEEHPDTSVEKKRIISDPSQISPFIMKSTWRGIYHIAKDKRALRNHQKREVEAEETNDVLADILRDEEEEGQKPDKKKKKSEKKKKDVHAKRKRQSEQAAEPPKENEEETHEATTERNQDFQEWLRREYYRNMAKSFASMRRKRDDSYVMKKRAKKSVDHSPTSLSDITDNLRDIEDQLFQDALQTLRDGGDDFDEDVRRQHRVSNDLNLAYDLETMRNAFFRLRETLANMEEDEEEDAYHVSRKRGRQCPALEQLTSDCSTLSDIMQDSSLKRLLRRACNWHEVCYTCGKAYGLTSEVCDGSFVEQTQTICQNDAPCESTASLMVIPLRQRRVFYKRSNPDVCVEEPCVEAFLKEGLAAMEEAQYAIRHA